MIQWEQKTFLLNLKVRAGTVNPNCQSWSPMTNTSTKPSMWPGGQAWLVVAGKVNRGHKPLAMCPSSAALNNCEATRLIPASASTNNQGTQWPHSRSHLLETLKKPPGKIPCHYQMSSMWQVASDQWQVESVAVSDAHCDLWMARWVYL